MFASADSIKSFLLAVQVTFLLIMFLLVMFSFLLTEIESADYVSAGHVLILPEEVSNFTPHVIEKLIKESRDEVTLAKVSSQQQSTYEAASILTEFELKKILLDKMEKSESYLTAPEHQDCYDGLKKTYALDKYFFYSYDVYSLKRGRKDKDKDEDPSVGSDRGLKKRKTSKDAEPITGQKKKDSTSGSSKGTKSQPKSSGKSVQSEEPVFEVADSDLPQDQ
ncbi:hypothetical protein Tco_0809127 [Tanacetum coccineum]